MGEIIVPQPTVQNDVDLVWPNMITAKNVGDTFDVNAGQRYSAAQYAMWVPVGGGTSNMTLDPRWGYIGQVASVPLGTAKAFTATGLQFRPILNKGGPALIYQYPTWQRVWRWQVTFQLQGPVLSTDGRSTFLGFLPNGGAGPDAVGSSYFGVVLGLDGRWKWVTRTGGGGFGFTEQVDLFPSVDTPHTLDFEILNATGQTDAVLNVFQDGNYLAPVITRAWGVGTKLPLYTATTVTATSWQARMQANDVGVTTVLQILNCRWTIGQFRASGVQVS